MAYELFIAPFADFDFMRRALVATLALALGAGPIGVFLMLRRMSLMGDAMAHAVLPTRRIEPLGFARDTWRERLEFVRRLRRSHAPNALFGVIVLEVLGP